jgi:N-acetylneuraminate synthase
MKKVYIISEIGINHNGDLNLAKELIDMSAEAGCDAVKFQKRTIDEVYTEEELDKPRDSPWGTTTREQKEGIEFSIEEYKVLEAYTKERGLDFIMSCWDLTSLKLVEEHLDVKYHKVASALLTDREFLSTLKETGKGVILSTGMTSQDEIDLAVEILGDSLVQIMACTSTYPTKPEEINLNYIKTLKEKFPNLVVGFSNHYSGALACHGAVVAGAEVIEFHITKDRTMYGSDQAASIENVDFLVHGVRTLELMLGDGVKVVYEAEKPIAAKLRKVKSLA